MEKKTSTHELAKKVRISILNMIYKSQSSHIASALSIVDILAILYVDFMKTNPSNPSDPDRDRFILSKGHACTALYAVLAEMNFFEKDLLETFAQNGSILMSHVSSRVPGVELSTGSLGHGLPVGVGLAIAAKRKKLNHKIIVLLSDGELNEGSNYEAMTFAAQNNLDNLFAIVDCNKFQALGDTSSIIDLEPLDEMFKTLRWIPKRCDGHDHESILLNLCELFNDNSPYPKILIADTIKGKGISFMENKLPWHYKSPNKDEYSNAIKELEELNN